MAKRWEHKATDSFGSPWNAGKPCAPEMPEGDGWELVSAIVCTHYQTPTVIWYWKREIE